MCDGSPLMLVSRRPMSIDPVDPVGGGTGATSGAPLVAGAAVGTAAGAASCARTVAADASSTAARRQVVRIANPLANEVGIMASPHEPLARRVVRAVDGRMAGDARAADQPVALRGELHAVVRRRRMARRNVAPLAEHRRLRDE